MSDSASYDPNADTVIYSTSEGVATITMDRPSYHNAKMAK